MWGVGIIKFAIGWPLSAVALFFVSRIIFSQQKNIVFKIEEPNVILLLSGTICFFLFYLTRSFVWKLILKELGYNIPLKTVSFLWEISELRRFVPGNIWSFLGRVTLFSNIGIPTKTIAKGLIIETQSFLLSCFIISTLGIFIYPKILPLKTPNIFFIPLIIILLFSTVLFINHSLLTRYIKGRLLSKIKVLFPNFSSKANTFILLLSLLYLILFGSGTYLTITSVVFISPEFFISLSGLFVFSLLVGYLSFITPMGLGVRESVMIVGLSQFVSLSIAGVASIFARIVLIVSELLFLLFTYLWQKARYKFATSLENFVASHKQEVIMAALIIVYIVYFTAVSFLRYDNFYTGRFDLGNMDQTVWNTLNGRIFELTDPNGIEIVSRLAYHADFILILLAPFYLLWDDPRMLLLIQTTVLAVGSVFVYKIANNTTRSKNLSLVFAAIFLLNPAVQYTNLYDFHPVTLATTFLLGTFYFLLKKRYVLFFLLAVLAALTKEQVWVIIALFGIYIFFSKPARHSEDSERRDAPDGASRSVEDSRISSSISDSGQARMTAIKMFGLIITLASLLVFYFLIWHAIPNALGSDHFALSYYSDFGDSPTNIVRNVFTSPHKLLSTIFHRDQLHYLQQLFLPLGFISLLSPILLILALPDLFINLLSNNPQLHQIYYQYSATITPFIFISAIFGVRNLKVWFPKLPNVLVTCYLLIVTCYSAYLFGPLPFSKSPNIDMFTNPQKNKAVIDNFISNIPSKYSVSATNNIGSHLSHRQNIYNVPLGIDTADYVAFLLDEHFAQPTLSDQHEMVEDVKNNKNYVEIFKIDNFIVFEKRNLLFAK